MKRILTLSVILCACVMGFAQSDTTIKKNNEPDTIKVGGMIIIRKGGGGHEIVRERQDNDSMMHHRKYNDKPSNVSTNWWIVDLGFSNFNDKTVYSSLAAQSFAPGSDDETFKLKTGKSRNVNLWFFMQRLNAIEHVVNIKYGLGLELNNYFFDDTRVHLLKNPVPGRAVIDPSYADLHKNKLAADYLTAPIMLNINFTPHRQQGFGFSGGVSAGYLYSSRQKIKDGGHISKTHDDFDLRKWKVSYIGELLLGPVKLYGSYATKSMWEKGLDQTPYTVGIRVSNW